jgi:hypothetical protein
MSFEINVQPDDMSVASESIYTMGSRTSSVKKHQKKVTDEMKQSDKGYCSYQSRRNSQKHSKVEMFDSGTCIGNRMRDPITGTRMPHRVGSKDEYTYFKVRISGLRASEPITLFYDSPEHYERHHKNTLSNEIKEKWHQKKFAENVYAHGY